MPVFGADPVERDKVGAFTTVASEFKAVGGAFKEKLSAITALFSGNRNCLINRFDGTHSKINTPLKHLFKYLKYYHAEK